MSLAKAKIHARLIYKGKENIIQFSSEDQVVIRRAYELIYGVDFP